MEYPDITHPWYAVNDGALVTFNNIELSFNSLKRFGPGHGYYHKPSKITLIVNPYYLVAREVFGLRHRFKVFMVAFYLGGFRRFGVIPMTWAKAF